VGVTAPAQVFTDSELMGHLDAMNCRVRHNSCWEIYDLNLGKNFKGKDIRTAIGAAIKYHAARGNKKPLYDPTLEPFEVDTMFLDWLDSRDHANRCLIKPFDPFRITHSHIESDLDFRWHLYDYASGYHINGETIRHVVAAAMTANAVSPCEAA
jgi:hypothetical protein